LKLAPDYAMAHALLAAIHSWRLTSMISKDPEADRLQARERAAEALALEPANPFVLIHCAEPAIYVSHDLEGAVEMLETAAHHGPNDPHGLALLAHARRIAGHDCETGPLLVKQAMRLSPRDPRTYVWHHYASWCHWQLGDFAAMEAACRRSVDLYSSYAWSWLALTCALGLQGQFDAARETAAEIIRLIPLFTPGLFFETAREFYGERFPGKVEADYRELCGVLARAKA